MLEEIRVERSDLDVGDIVVTNVGLAVRHDWFVWWLIRREVKIGSKQILININRSFVLFPPRYLSFKQQQLRTHTSQHSFDIFYYPLISLEMTKTSSLNLFHGIISKSDSHSASLFAFTQMSQIGNKTDNKINNPIVPCFFGSNIHFIHDLRSFEEEKEIEIYEFGIKGKGFVTRLREE